MALEHAILVSLRERPATGYDLARRFDASIGHFWQASHQQIYKVLGRMEETDWVSAIEEAREGRAPKRTYSITDLGVEELLRFSGNFSEREVQRSDFAVKLRGFLDPDLVAADTRHKRAEHQARLDHYRASMARYYPSPAELEGRDLGSYLTLLGGIRLEKSHIEWCDEILSYLEADL